MLRRRILAFIVLPIAALSALVTGSACRRQGEQAIDPQVVLSADAFLAALTAHDVASLGEFFSETVLVGGESGFAGAPASGFVEVDRGVLVEAYRSLFTRLGPAGWAAVMEARKPLLNVALHDGQHAGSSKTGDYIYELVRPNTTKLEPILIFVFRKISGKYLIVAQHTTFERPAGIAQSVGR